MVASISAGTSVISSRDVRSFAEEENEQRAPAGEVSGPAVEPRTRLESRGITSMR